MNAKELFDLAPYGALIRFSTNTPQPPAHHKKKLASWKCENGTAFFTQAGMRSSGPEFGLTQFGMIQFTHIYGVHSAKTFEIERQPVAGTILVRNAYAEERGAVELHGICASPAEARSRFGRSYSTKFWRVAEDGSLVDWTLPAMEDAHAA